MKNTLTFICLLFLSVISEAQSFYNAFPYQVSLRAQKKKNYIKQAGVQTRTYEFYTKRGTLKKCQVNFFSRAGLSVQYQLFNKNKQLLTTAINLYLADTFMTGQAIVNAKGDTLTQYHNSYDEQGNITRYYSRTGKNSWENVYRYNSKNQRTGWDTYINGKLKWITEYEYNDSGRLAGSLLYDAKHTLKKKTTYVCDYRGETVSKDVKQTNMCSRQQPVPGGGFVFYDDHTNEKGQLNRYIYTYDADSNLLQFESYNAKNRLVTKRAFTYNAEGTVTQEIASNAKRVLYIYEYQYNEKNLLHSSIRFNGQKEKLSTEAYQYTYY